jgi:hypothetical protein
MVKRTSLTDIVHINDADDLETVVKDKRQQWRANNAKARRRQRRYKNKLTQALTQQYIQEIE